MGLLTLLGILLQKKLFDISIRLLLYSKQGVFKVVRHEVHAIRNPCSMKGKGALLNQTPQRLALHLTAKGNALSHTHGKDLHTD